MRALVAVPIAVVVCAAAPAFADASAHIAAAKKAERSGEWRKALQEWKAAYAAEPNTEYLIGIGDALVQLGDKAEAKKNYEAYLTDPLALPANVDKVKKKLALQLPGLPVTAPAKKEPEKMASATPLLPLPLPGAPAKAETKRESAPAV